MRRHLAALLLCLALVTLSSGHVNAVTVDEYGDLFDAVLNNMLDNYA